MNNFRFLPRVVAALVTVSLITGCASLLASYPPEQFAVIEEAYPDGQLNITADVPKDSYRKVLFDAPFGEVFRAAMVGLAQIKDKQGNTVINIESTDKARGIILATEASLGRAFYAVSLKKTGPARTEMTVARKDQTKCEYIHGPGLCCFSALTLGIMLPTMLDQNSKCTKQSSVHWTEHGLPRINDIISATRNNLIQSGNL